MGSRCPTAESRLWEETIFRVRTEYALLPAAEREWVEGQLANIGNLQQQLHQLFLLADGPALCVACDGACCGRGRNHLTLANLLAVLGEGGDPPVPDFSAPCPLLSPRGCQLPAPNRPFNCVIFLCETIEARLAPADLRHFYEIEQALRTLYQELAGRYAIAGCSGLLLRAERLGNRAFFGRL